MSLTQDSATTSAVPQRDWDALFNPSVVALVGASANPTKWGHLLSRNLLLGAHRRTVRLVTRSGGEILGTPAFTSLGDLPEAPDLVVIAVPRPTVEATVEEALAAGAKAIIVITVGFRESGEEGRALEAVLVEKVRAAGALLIGPNCNGIRVDDANLDAMTWLDDPQGGSLGVISQSGGVITELVSVGRGQGVGFSRLVSFGNQADVTAAELLGALAADPATDVVGVYLEEVRDLDGFIAAAREAIDGGTDVIVLTPPQAVATARAVRAHTGSILADQEALRAATLAAGIVHVSTPPDLIEAAQTLRVKKRIAGLRVGVVADGGGQAVLGTGAAVDHGLLVPEFSDALDAALAEGTTAASARRNPVDITGGAAFELTDYADAIRVVADSGEVDAVLFSGMFGGYAPQSEEFVQEELEAAAAIVEVARGPIPLVVHTWYGETEPARILREGGVPVFDTVSGAARALVRLYERQHRTRVVPGRAGVASGLEGAPTSAGADAPAGKPATVSRLVETARADIPSLTTAELQREIAAGGVTVVDVRDERERVRDGAIEGAVHVPRGFLEFWADPSSEYHRASLDPSHRTITYCAGGWRSALAAKTLRELGYADVGHLDTGFDGWKADGGEWTQVDAR